MPEIDAIKQKGLSMEEQHFQKDTYSIRVARPEDAEALLNIYAPFVIHTAITFEYEVPSVEEFRERICRTLERYPYLVAWNKETNENGNLHI